MKKFPDNLNVVNKDKFNNLFHKRTLCYLRRDIYEHMVSRKDETIYFDIQDFRTRYKLKTDTVRNMIDTTINELEVIGWKCKLSFGNTGLFIYSTDTPPVNCYPDEI
jgi:hypothetical protein